MRRFAVLLSFALACSTWAMDLILSVASVACNAPPASFLSPPAAAKNRLPESQVVRGQNDIRWAWLGSPTLRYPHGALGSPAHAGSLHVLVTNPSGDAREVVLHLPLLKVFEDRIPRLVDLDGDGRDEIIVVQSDALQGSALVVLGLRNATKDKSSPLELVELARGPNTGSTFRWLNPVGVADFDGDGHLDVASVTTPHIGGVLTLHHYRPPQLVPYAKTMDISNHRMGALEQSLAVIVKPPGQRPTVIVPDMTHRALHALRWVAPGRWEEMQMPTPVQDRIARMEHIPEGACLLLDNASWWRATLRP
jgi:hypothetical protein